MTWKNELTTFKTDNPNLAGFVGKFSKETQLAFLKRMEEAGKLPGLLATAVRGTTALTAALFLPGNYGGETVVTELRSILNDMPLVRSICQVFSTEGTHFDAIRSFVSVQPEAGLNDESVGASLNDEPDHAGTEVSFKFIDGNDSFTVTACNKPAYVDQVTAAILGNREAGRATPSWSNGLDEAAIKIFASAKWEEKVAKDTDTARVSMETTSKKTVFGA